jgi:Putative Flp pilus-assembly TadE/G-like
MHRDDSDRGAVLLHVIYGLVALFLITAFVVDYGTFWVSRGQAQNAADAGALAGATARLYDDTSDPPSSTTSGVVPESVYSAAAHNLIWGDAPPSNTIVISYTCPDGTTECVAVDVYRDGTHNSAMLPTFFLRLININSQGVKAHAVADSAPANGTGCLRPWFLPAPTGSGLDTPYAYGMQVQLHENQNSTGPTPSGYQQLDVGSGGSAIRDAIERCASQVSFSIGQTVDAKPGGTQGPEAQGVQQLFDWDPNATVTGMGADTKVTGGCAEQAGGCSCPGNPNSVCPNGAYASPRIAVVAMCDPAQANCNSNGQSNGQITITNFLAFFITGCNRVPNVCKQGGGNLEIDATLIATAGDYFASGGTPVSGQSFLRTISLVR